MDRFSRDRLRELAGEGAFARRETYYTDGAVSLVQADAHEVVAEVRGQETYRVGLYGSGSDFSSACSCPAFDRGAWCKHLVAVALAVNTDGDDLPDPRVRLRGHLLSLGVDALADMLLDLAKNDTALMRRLDLAASAAATPPAEHAKMLRKTLREVLRSREFISWRAVGGWAQEVLDALDQALALILAA